MTFQQIRAYGILGNSLPESGSFALVVIVYIALAVVAYLLGSLNFAIIISKVKYKDDIRKYGSGNAGMTNMIRTYGTAAGVVTFLGDIFKAVVSVLLATLLMGEYCGYIAGLACILGHCFPVWYKFKGGKGVAVTAAMILTLEPFVFLTLLIVFIACVLITRYISLGSMMAALVYPLMLKNFYRVTHPGSEVLPFIPAVISIAIALMIIFMHRENIKRLLKRQENKFSFKKKGTNNSTPEEKKEKRSLHHDED